jgi:hypothetical protein
MSEEISFADLPQNTDVGVRQAAAGEWKRLMGQDVRIFEG